MLPNTVQFTLPSLPGSVNRIYAPGYSIYSQKPEWKLSPDWQAWQSRMLPYIPRFEIQPGSLICCNIMFYYDFYYPKKRTELRPVDTHNMVKLLIDTIERKNDWNDKVVKTGSWDSEHLEGDGKVRVTLKEYPQRRESDEH